MGTLYFGSGAKGRAVNRRMAAMATALVALLAIPVMPGAGAPVYTIELGSPDGGESLVQGQSFAITWAASDSGGFIVIQYATESKGAYTTIATVNNTLLSPHKYSWFVPFGVNSTKCSVKLSWLSSLGYGGELWAEDTSASYFSIGPGLVLDFNDMPDTMSYPKYYPISWVIYDTNLTVAGLDMEFRSKTGSTWGAWEVLSDRYREIPDDQPYHFFMPPNIHDAKGQLRLLARESYPAGPVIGESYSPEFNVSLPDVVPPGQVQTFNARARQGKVLVTWTEPLWDGGSPISNYVLLRGPVYNNVTPIRDFPPDARSWTDDTVELGKTYFYVIYAQNKAGDGQRSPAVGVWVNQGAGPPDMPSGLNATASPGQVRLSWSPPEYDGGSPLTGYVVRRSEDPFMTSPPLLAEVGVVLGYVDKAVKPNTTYYYYIEAVNKEGRSPPFGPVNATVPPGSGGGGNGGGGNTVEVPVPMPVLALGIVAAGAAAAAAGIYLIKRRK